jgi:4-hydroxy-3-polyprenylbenzoate decarboxylase
MAIADDVSPPLTAATRGYRDLREHIAALDRAGLLYRIDRAIDKDSEMHPLVRWQYRGGVPEAERKAFLFTNVVDATGRRYENPVLVAGLAGSRPIYAIGMDAPLEEIGARWLRALEAPIEPVLVTDAPAQEVVHTGEELVRWGGLLNLPVPISTPGYDNAPYFSSAHYITKDPDTGVPNCGNYRGQLKGPTTVGVYFVPFGNDSQVHWEKARARGEHLPVAIVIGAPPVVSYTAVQRVPIEANEFALAGALAGAPIRMVRCRTIDIEVPAESEVVIEGWMRTDVLEPEGPFGESHGFVHPRSESPIIEVTAITHRRDFIQTSFISQVTPSESSTIKRVSYEPMFLNFLRTTCGVKSVKNVVMHEALTNIRPVVFLQFTRRPAEGEVWRALKLASGFKVGVGKLIVAVDEDIDPNNLDAVMWSLAYRMTPHVDVQIVRGYDKAHAPPFREIPEMENSVMLINATLREDLPPISLPKRAYMERSRAIWDELGLPPITPEPPWHGYSLGEWWDELDDEAQLAVEGRWAETGAKLAARRTTIPRSKDT